MRCASRPLPNQIARITRIPGPSIRIALERFYVDRPTAMRYSFDENSINLKRHHSHRLPYIRILCTTRVFDDIWGRTLLLVVHCTPDALDIAELHWNPIFFFFFWMSRNIDFQTKRFFSHINKITTFILYFKIWIIFNEWIDDRNAVQIPPNHRNCWNRHFCMCSCVRALKEKMGETPMRLHGRVESRGGECMSYDIIAELVFCTWNQCTNIHYSRNKRFGVKEWIRSL